MATRKKDAGRKPAATKEKSAEIVVHHIVRGVTEVCIVGTTPLIPHRFADKARQELLLPKGRKTEADKKAALKHDPYHEFVQAAYQTKDPDMPTLLYIPSTAIKSAIMCTALDVPGTATKAAIGRLAWVRGEQIPVYGIPRLRMDMVRQKDVARTPDVRTRPCLVEWAMRFEVEYASPMLNANTIHTLVANSGFIQGVCDYRAEKGKGNYGSYELCKPGDAEFKRICRLGREKQMKAMLDPEFYNEDTQELFEWFEAEATARGFGDKFTRRATAA